MVGWNEIMMPCRQNLSALGIKLPQLSIWQGNDPVKDQRSTGSTIRLQTEIPSTLELEMFADFSQEDSSNFFEDARQRPPVIKLCKTMVAHRIHLMSLLPKAVWWYN
ncbi:hypothetical protein SAMN05421690_101546 [Nitrosomonas sp. Nm51]|nr:hypothetical protein SAMN05421690_101546 [Nitrosomonas sp. Nm51]